ncbi:hypothetical protein TomMM35A_33690 [Sphingobium sp. TomMM35A]
MYLKNYASKWTLLAGASVIAALAMSSSAQAACTTAVSGSITCTGDNQPFTVTFDAQTTVAEGATVTGSGLSAIRLNSANANLRIDGMISATGAAALTVQNGLPVLNYDPYAGVGFPNGNYSYPYLYPNGQATIVVGEQGRISGDVGIWIERSSSNYLGGSTESRAGSAAMSGSGSSGRAAITWAVPPPRSTIAA